MPYARGREIYRPAPEILAEVAELAEKHFKEITLIAQNVNSYQWQNVDFPQLLRQADEMKGNFWLRFSTSHPKDVSDELIQVMAKAEKTCPHFHLPVQSGSDEILLAMNRHYSRQHYLNLINKARQAINQRIGFQAGIWHPPLSISTDIIVGFPGETKQHFEETMALLEEAKFDMAYIARYSPRPQTAAARLVDDVPPEEKKRREEKLTQILRRTALANNQQYLNKVVAVLLTDNKKNHWLGKTTTAKTVKLSPISGLKKGDRVAAKIININDFGLEGKILEKI